MKELIEEGHIYRRPPLYLVKKEIKKSTLGMIHSEIKPMREWAVVLLFNVTKVLGDECRACGNYNGS
jgi:DNA gyrase/topoisomerase IV subunit B